MSENINSMHRRRKISGISTINDISSNSSSNSSTNSSTSSNIPNKRYRNNNDSYNTLDEANTSNEEIGLMSGQATNSWSPISNKLLRSNKKSNLGSISKGLNNIIESNSEAHSKTDNQRGQSLREHYPHFQNDFGNPMSYNDDNNDDNDWGFFM